MKIEGTFPKYKIEFEEGEHYPAGIVYVDFSKCKDYKPEWKSEAFDLIARTFHVDIETVAHAFGVIYENDMPDWEDVNFAQCHSKKLLNNLRKQRNSYRWKPNGITDNIEEWEKKNMKLLENNPEYKAQRCLDVINIYADVAQKTRALIQNLNP